MYANSEFALKLSCKRVLLKITRLFSKQKIGPVSDAPGDAQRPVPMTDEKGSV